MHKNSQDELCGNSECDYCNRPDRCKHHHEDDHIKHNFPDPHHHHSHSMLDDILQRHNERTNDYNNSQTELAQQQEELSQYNLQVIHHLLNNEVRVLLEQHQHTLCLNGYHTGIQETMNQEYVTSISLHLSDVPSNDPNPKKDSKSINQIRFFGVPQSSEIQCQYMNSQFQSKNFTLGLEPELHSNLSEQGDTLLQDFISFVLLFKRAELTTLR